MEASHNKNAGMNYPPQSTNSSIMKYALCLMKTHIEDNDLTTKSSYFFPSMTSRYQKREDYAAQWAITQTELMEKLLCMLYPRALKAESDIMDHWTKG
jgi:hypothetical protein